MAALANINLTFPLTFKIGFCIPVLVGAVSDGSGVIDGGGTVTLYLAFSAGAQGSWVKEARIKLGSTTGIIASSATTMRFYLSTVNSGSPTTANSHPITEIGIPILTPQLNSATPDLIVPFNFAIPASSYILCNIGVVQTTNAVWQVSIIGGDY